MRWITGRTGKHQAAPARSCEPAAATGCPAWRARTSSCSKPRPKWFLSRISVWAGHAATRPGSADRMSSRVSRERPPHSTGVESTIHTSSLHMRPSMACNIAGVTSSASVRRGDSHGRPPLRVMRRRLQQIIGLHMERGREGVQLCLHAMALDALVLCAQPIPWNRSSSGPRGRRTARRRRPVEAGRPRGPGRAGRRNDAYGTADYSRTAPPTTTEPGGTPRLR